MQDLGTLSGPDAQVEAMSERGQIVGTSYTSSTPNPGSGIPTIDPFLWENGSMVDIGTLGGTNGLAHFVNSRGQVVGVSNLAGDSTSHPFLWSNGKLMGLGDVGRRQRGGVLDQRSGGRRREGIFVWLPGLPRFSLEARCDVGSWDAIQRSVQRRICH